MLLASSESGHSGHAGSTSPPQSEGGGGLARHGSKSDQQRRTHLLQTEEDSPAGADNRGTVTVDR